MVYINFEIIVFEVKSKRSHWFRVKKFDFTRVQKEENLKNLNHDLYNLQKAQAGTTFCNIAQIFSHFVLKLENLCLAWFSCGPREHLITLF